MKRFFLFAVTCLITLMLVGCVGTKSRYYDNQIQGKLASEGWMRYFNFDPNTWTRTADRWFFTDEPRNFDEYESNAPINRAITAMMVRVPDFTNIVVNGPYRVQIYGSQLHNTVYVLGPNESARRVSVNIRGNTLYIQPDPQCRATCLNNMGEIIVRIGIRDLNYLCANGSGLIEGKNVYSSQLAVKAIGTGPILLSGNMRLTKLLQTGTATVSMIGVNSPITDVKVTGGTVNISGHVGIRNIIKSGACELNILGADTDCLNINSSGTGLTRIVGYANLRKLDATGNSRVYLYWVASNGAYITARQNARVGLAGAAQNIDVQVSGNARFGGKYLKSENVYVRTTDLSHANVYPIQKMFANALDNSSIYFFGSPNVVSRYTSGNSIVLPIFESCPVPIRAAPAVGCATLKGERAYTQRPVRRYYRPVRNYKDERPFIRQKHVTSYRKTTIRHNPSYIGEIPYRNVVPD